MRGIPSRAVTEAGRWKTTREGTWSKILSRVEPSARTGERDLRKSLTSVSGQPSSSMKLENRLPSTHGLLDVATAELDELVAARAGHQLEGDVDIA